MISRLIVLFSFCVVLGSCVKSTSGGCSYSESGIVVPASELSSLQGYVAGNHPGAIQHPGGFYYEITSQGTGSVTPAVCSNIVVTYTGRLTNGTQFDENTTGAAFVLGQLIVGWQRGLPLIKSGGSINLYLPPSLGWGANVNGSIPANSITIFSIQLLDVQ